MSRADKAPFAEEQLQLSALRPSCRQQQLDLLHSSSSLRQGETRVPCLINSSFAKLVTSDQVFGQYGKMTVLSGNYSMASSSAFASWPTGYN